MIAQELEVSLHMAFVEARQKRHEFITVEHLLLALLDNPTAAEVLRACAANIDELRKALADFINAHTPTVAGTEEIDTQPTLGFSVQSFTSSPPGKRKLQAPTYSSRSSAKRIRTLSISSTNKG